MEESIDITFRDIDVDEARHRVNAIDYFITLCELREWLRAKYKYSDEDMFDIEKLSDEFYEIIESNNINIQ